MHPFGQPPQPLSHHQNSKFKLVQFRSSPRSVVQSTMSLPTPAPTMGVFTPARVQQFCWNIGFPVESTKTQRIIGPIAGASPPKHGTEVFVANLPKHHLEDELFPVFARIGSIYKFRLMLHNIYQSRGSAYVTYDSITDANRCVQLYHGKDIIPGCRIMVEKSKDNRRLFLGGIPDYKTKDDVWRELTKLGMDNVVDVIMYRSYTDKNRNRGFVFIEFNTHQEAAHMKYMYTDSMLFGKRITLDWSTPINDINEEIMEKVKIIFLKNLSINITQSDLVQLLRCTLQSYRTVEKVYKFRDYAFIHFITRRDAQKALWELKSYYGNMGSDVTIEWAKPPPPHPRKFAKNGMARQFQAQRPAALTRCMCREHGCFDKMTAHNSFGDSDETTMSPNSVPFDISPPLYFNSLQSTFLRNDTTDYATLPDFSAFLQNDTLQNTSIWDGHEGMQNFYLPFDVNPI